MLASWTLAFCNAADVLVAVWDGSGASIGISCTEWVGFTIDRPDISEIHFGEREATEKSPIRDLVLKDEGVPKLICEICVLQIRMRKRFQGWSASSLIK